MTYLISGYNIILFVLSLISGYRVSPGQGSESLSVSVQGSAGAPHQKRRIQIVQHDSSTFTCSKRVSEAPHGTYDSLGIDKDERGPSHKSLIHLVSVSI